MRLTPLFSGGGQERGLRSGTLPSPLIVGLGEACRLAQAEMAEEAQRLASLRDRLLDRLRAAIPDIVVNGSTEARIPGNLNLTFPVATAADLMARVPDLCVSTGSACSSATIEPSYVLRALGLTRRGRVAYLAHRHRTLYLARRYRLCGGGAGCGACRGARARR